MFVADLSAYLQVKIAFEGIFAEQGGATEGSVTLPKALMTQCIAYLLRSLSDQSDGRLPWLTDPNLSHAVDTLFNHPQAAHTVDSLTGGALMSRSGLRGAFPISNRPHTHKFRS